MLDSITKALDYILHYRRDRRVDRKERFVNVFEPVFNDLQNIHIDYLSIFKEVIECLIDRNETLKVRLERSIGTLKDRRHTLLAIRRKLKSFVSVRGFRSFALEEQHYVQTVNSYLSVEGYESSGHTLTTYVIFDLESYYFDIDRLDLSPENLGCIADRIAYRVERLNKEWSAVCSKYMELKLFVYQ